MEKLLRFVATWSWMLCTLPLLWLAIPLRVLHPILRLFGVPNRWLPLDVVARYWARSVVLFAGTRVRVEGDVSDVCDPVVLTANHASGLDAFVLMGYSPVGPKFVYRRTLMLAFPPLFAMAYFYGHVPINRGNRESAIASLAKAGKTMRRDNRSLAVFPEGTRSKTGRLQAIKKGTFHVAAGAEVDIAPAHIHNAWSLWAPKGIGGVFPSPGVVRLRFLPLIRNPRSGDVKEDAAAMFDTFCTVMQREDEQAWSEPAPAGEGGSIVWPSAWLVLLASLVWRYFF